MKKLFYIALAAILCGCSKSESAECCGGDKVQVEIRAEAEVPATVSRATDEDGIHDLNLYLFSRNWVEDYHFYVQGSSIDITVNRDAYDVFIVANHGADLGERTKSQCYSIPADFGEEPQRMPMGYEGVLSFSGSKVVRLPARTVKLKRSLAKVDLDVVVAPNVEGITLRSLKLVHVPRNMNYFSQSPSKNAAMYYDRVVDEADVAPLTISGSFYLPENKQGRVSSITAQEQKNTANAPALATYLSIEAEKEGRTLHYNVFPGGNHTDDFNILRNYHYKILVNILSDSETDARIIVETP